MSPTFLAVGLTGTGKSEMCYWMTGNLRQCNPSGSMQSNTSKVEVVKAFPFDDMKMGNTFKWIDTPGRGDTRGEGNDTSMWNETMSFLVSMSASKSDFVDRIVWVINAAWQRATAARTLILRELRRSFGLHLYKHLDLVFNFLPHGPNKTAYDREVLQPIRSKFIDWIQEQEIELFNWSNTSEIWQGVQEQINRTGCYGVSIHPAYLKQLPPSLRLSSPHLDRFSPFSHPAGVSELMRLYQTAQKEKKSGFKGLDLKNRHPPVGPGVLEQIASVFYRCGLVQDGWDSKKLQVGIAAVHTKLSGKYFSEGDQAVLLPQDQECGDPNFPKWAKWANFIRAPREMQNTDQNTSIAEYWLPTPFDEDIDMQLCFCEAPKCTQSWRFGQSIFRPPILPQGLKQQCSGMIDRIYYSGKVSSGWGSWAKVGNTLFGLPWWDTSKVLVLDLVRPKTSQLSNLPVSNPTGRTFKFRAFGTGYSSAVVNECIYAAPFHSGADSLLVVNASSRTANLLRNQTYLKGSHEHLFSGVVAVERTLYLIPRHRSRESLLSIDVSSNPPFFQSVAFNNAQLKECLGRSNHPNAKRKFVSARTVSMWFDVVAVRDSLFAAPSDAECMLVFHTKNRTFEAIDTTSVQTGANKWTRLLEVDGTLYAAPSGHKKLLAVEIATKTPRGIPLECYPGDLWTSMARHNNHLYLVPSYGSHSITVFDLETESSSCFWHQFMEYDRKGSNLYMDAVVLGHKLYALPDGKDSILVLDFQLDIAEDSSENATLPAP